jgi:hydrogenase/urease accessory protein HupE
MRPRPRHAGAGLALLACAIMVTTPAEAHIVATRLGDFYAGAVHPATDLYDVILWLALGLLAGSLGADRSRWLVLLFPLGLATGFLLAPAGGSFAGDALASAAWTCLLGLLLAAGLRLPSKVLGLTGFALAVVRGMANAAGTGPETNMPLFAAGLVCAGYAVITLTMALVVTFRRADGGERTAWRAIVLRALGGWIAAIGLMMIGLTFAAPATT